MVLFNYSTKELTAKVVYYGPGLCGKTTNLQFIHQNLPPDVRGKMLSLATKTDRTLFFDFLPIDLGSIRGMKTRVQLYTVPGQVFYNETRRLVLKGADGIVFVADSQAQMLKANIESFRNLEENLKAHGMKLSEMPHVLQLNKRDLPRLSSVEELNAALNKYNAPFYESVATTGIGVQDTLKAVAKLVLLHLTRKYDPGQRRASAAATPAARPAATPAVAAAVTETPAPPAPAPAARSVPVSEFTTPADEVKSVPVSAAAEPQPEPASTSTPPPPPDFHGTGHIDDEPAPEFGEEDIEEFVEEVEETEHPVQIPADTHPEATQPLAAAASGTPETEEFEVGGFDADGASPAMTAGPAALDSLDAGEGVPHPPAFGAPASGPAVPQKHVPPPADDPAQGAAFSFPHAADEEQGGEAPPFEVDKQFDPEWPEEGAAPTAPEPPLAASALAEESPRDETPHALGPPAAETYQTPAHETPESEPPVVLSEIASDTDLFDDPDVAVAHMASGEDREIIVPVEVGEGPTLRRYKLSIRLHLQPVD